MNKAERRAQILGADDLPREPVDQPWTDEKLYARGLSASERDAWMATASPDGELRWTSNLTADLVVKTLVDEDGERVFEDGDAEALGRKSGVVLAEIFTVVMRLSGLTEEVQEQIAVDFGGARSGASSSG